MLGTRNQTGVVYALNDGHFRPMVRNQTVLIDRVSFALGTSRDRFEIIAFLCSLKGKFTRVDTLRQMGFLEEDIQHLLKELSEYFEYRIMENCLLALSLIHI